MENKYVYYNVEIEGTGFSIDIPSFEIKNEEELREPGNKQVMFKAILNSVFMMETTNLKSVPCFIVNGAQCNVDLEGIEGNLDRALEYYTEEEEYETCITINNLKNKLCSI